MTNTITIDGRLARDPELKYLGKGQPVANLRIGHTPRDRKGTEWVDGETVWLDVEVWGSPAETITEAASQGDLVLVSGEYRQRSYETNGEKRTSHEIKRASVAVLRKKGATQPPTQSAPASNDPWASVPAPTEEPAW